MQHTLTSPLLLCPAPLHCCCPTYSRGQQQKVAQDKRNFGASLYFISEHKRLSLPLSFSHSVCLSLSRILSALRSDYHFTLQIKLILRIIMRKLFAIVGSVSAKG